MSKTMVTWLGEDDLHSTTRTDDKGREYEQPVPGPSFLFWGDIRFDKDKPTLIDTDAKVGPEQKAVIDRIALRTPNMKRFKVEPLQERHQSKG